MRTKSFPMVVQWGWQDQDGGSHAFDSVTCSQLEQAYQQWHFGDRQPPDSWDDDTNDGQLSLQQDMHNYEVCFVDMVCRDVPSGRIWTVVREDSYIQWSWAGGRSRMQPFGPEANIKLEEAFLKWQSVGSNKPPKLRSGNNLYEISFARMTQTNVVSGKSRGICRYINAGDSTPLHKSVSGFHAEDDSKVGAGAEGRATRFVDVKASTEVAAGIDASCTDASCEDLLVHTLEVSVEGKLMRLRVALSSQSSPPEALKVVRDVVRDAGSHCMEMDEDFSLTYSDEDGDKCMLMPETLEDCISFTRKGVLNLTLEWKSAEKPEAATEPAARIAASMLTESPRGSGPSHISSRDGSDDESSWSLVEVGCIEP